MRLIDADKLKDIISDTWILDRIDEQPTIDPVKYGRWIKMSDADGIYYACSECGNELPREIDFNPQFDLFPKLKSIDKTIYCPCCGAKMDDGERRENADN